MYTLRVWKYTCTKTPTAFLSRQCVYDKVITIHEVLNNTKSNCKSTITSCDLKQRELLATATSAPLLHKNDDAFAFSIEFQNPILL